MPRLPLDVPIAIHLSPRVLFALRGLFDDQKVFDDLQEGIALQSFDDDGNRVDGVDAEELAEATIAELYHAVKKAERRPSARRVEPKHHVRPVLKGGAVRVGWNRWCHPFLATLDVGTLVRCAYETRDGHPVCVVSEAAHGQELCVAVPERRARTLPTASSPVAPLDACASSVQVAA